MSDSAANVEIELISLIANKTGKFHAIIMQITFYRKKIAIVSQKTSNFAMKADWIDQNRLFKEEIFADSAIFLMISIYLDPVFSQSSVNN